VTDRDCDREILFNHLLDKELRFIVRLVGDRTLLWKGKPFIAGKFAAKFRMRHAETIWRETEESEKRYEIQYGAMDIRLLDYTRLKNIMAVVLAAVFFASCWLGESVRRGVISRESRSACSASPISTTTRSPTASRGSSTDAADGAARKPHAAWSTCSKNCPCSRQAENWG
jgi:hypothetical protein